MATKRQHAIKQS